jgi:DNA mismatch repair protein MutL
VFGAVVRALREAIQSSGDAAPFALRRGDLPPPIPIPVAPAEPAPLVAPLFARALDDLGGAPLPPPEVGRFLQVHRRYVVEETAGGLRLVDPHALHERILYQEILLRLAREPLEAQRFLFPLVLEVDPLERLALAEREPLLARLGFEVGPFGPAALAIHAAPRLLRAERAAEAVRALLDRDPEGVCEGEPMREVLHELAASLACKAAVRFGDALPDGQLAELLGRRTQVENGHCCPHGRPTALVISLDELDHRFQRQGAPAVRESPLSR